MDIIITKWALDAYLNLKHQGVFTQDEFEQIIQPDVLLLKQFPQHPKFLNGKFWSFASLKGQTRILHGFKMKWHQIGSGKVQLRLPIMQYNHQSFLCEAYVKHNHKVDARKLAKFKVHIQLIMQGNYKHCGVIT